MQVMFRQIQRDPTAMIGQGLADLRGNRLQNGWVYREGAREERPGRSCSIAE